MIVPQLLKPNSIVVVGASDNTAKPGGKVLQNLIQTGYIGQLYALNPKPIIIEGAQYVNSLDALPNVDLAIMAIPAQQCNATVKQLIAKGTKAFIIYSAGFSEAGEEGIALEKELVEMIQQANATLIGPNGIGWITETYKGVFTSPIPTYYPMGCELISSSGATAVFIMEAALKTGLQFSNIYSIGNAAHTGVEDLLEYMDNNYKEGSSPKVKLLYLEQIKNPFKFIKHSTSLRKKGCKIAAIKSGISDAGGRAASSHTGAMASSDLVIRALFKKCGIVYCSSREELIAVAGVFQSKELQGDKIAIITHAGGSAVMLTDALSCNGMEVPAFNPKDTAALLTKLHPGSSVANPIDFLATGTAAQLAEIIDFCEHYDVVDAMVVVFGSPGLFNVKDVYDVLETKMQQCQKPIFPVLPSLINAKEEIKSFLANGRVNFSDEVALGKALAHSYKAKEMHFEKFSLPDMDWPSIRAIINAAPQGYLSPDLCRELLDAAQIPLVFQQELLYKEQLDTLLEKAQFPLVMKVVGPVHKTEVGGVVLNIFSKEQALSTFNELMKIPAAQAVLVQEMLSGEELYCGAIKQGDFGHVVMCGLGGIYLELLKDTAAALAPLSINEVSKMIQSLKCYPIFTNYRNQAALNENLFNEIIQRIAALVHLAPEIEALDLNPIIARNDRMHVVDVRIKISKI